MVGTIVLLLFHNLLEEAQGFTLSVVSLECLVTDEGVRVTEHVPVNHVRRVVTVEQGRCEYLCRFAQAVPHGPPNELHFFLCDSVLPIFEVYATNKEGIEAHFCEEPCVGARVTEGIDLPADAGLDTKRLKDEIVARLHVVQHVFEVRAGFIVHGPASAQ